MFAYPTRPVAMHTPFDATKLAKRSYVASPGSLISSNNLRGHRRASMTLIFKFYFLSETCEKRSGILTSWQLVRWFRRSKAQSHKLHRAHGGSHSGGINLPKNKPFNIVNLMHPFFPFVHSSELENCKHITRSTSRAAVVFATISTIRIRLKVNGWKVTTWALSSEQGT